MTRHPTRKELLEAARSNSDQYTAHFKACADCRELFEFYRAYQVAGKLPLGDAPEGWIVRAAKLAEEESVFTRVKELLAGLVFDSWTTPVSVGVRGGGTQQERRLRFQIDDLMLDLRAEKQKNGWDFVAQLSGDRVAQENFVILVAHQELRVNSEGFYQWSSKTPPKQIRIRSDKYIVQTPDISWKAAPRP